LWDEFFEANHSSFVPSVDVVEDSDQIHIKMELPGLKKEDIQVEYADNVLSVSGEKKLDTKQEENNIVYREIEAGQFLRRFSVKDIDFEKSKADFKDGVLILHLPKSETQKPKKLLL
jgi:HSP20 family protein